MHLTDILYFLGASILLTLAPGPDNTFVIAQGLSRGRKAAVITALGMCSGVSVHTTAAALGVSALLYSSAFAFAMLKYAGAAYLLYLAYKAIKEHQIRLAQSDDAPLRLGQLFRRGFIMNVLNPKVALFFLAFLPQFVSPDGVSAPLQMMLFGLIFMACAGYTLLRNEHVRIDLVSNRFSRRGQAWIDILGILFFLLPMAIAILVLSWPVFTHAWTSNEMSNSAGGLPMWPARLMIPAGFLLLILQALSELIKRVGFLKGLCADPTEKKSTLTAEEELAAAIKAHAEKGGAQ